MAYLLDTDVIIRATNLHFELVAAVVTGRNTIHETTEDTLPWE
jgi:hypothetical protein